MKAVTYCIAVGYDDIVAVGWKRDPAERSQTPRPRLVMLEAVSVWRIFLDFQLPGGDQSKNKPILTDIARVLFA